MSAWLAIALAELATAGTAEGVPIVPIVPKPGTERGSGTIGTIGTGEGGAHAPDTHMPFADDLAALCAANPTDDDRRWRQAQADAHRFVRNWGDQAAALGWRPDELFGLHPLAPLARYDAMGLLWLLGGRRVMDISESAATLENGLRFRRRCR